MRVGGKRTAVIPGDMSPGSPPAGPGAPAPVPRLAPSVVEIELIEVI
jgi:FKBP-type peptidyl-prolyl cis-trans isomerase